MGIVSASTPWADVTKKLTLYGTVTNTGNLVEVYAGDGKNLYRVVPEPDYKTVAALEIYVQNNPQFPTLKELIRQYGVPCGVLSPRQSGTLRVTTLLYPAMDIEIVKSGSSLDLNAKITVVTLVVPTRLTGNQDLCTLGSLDKAPVLPWHGFASWQYYATHGLAQF